MASYFEKKVVNSKCHNMRNVIAVQKIQIEENKLNSVYT
jgi:hypothetical protein